MIPMNHGEQHMKPGDRLAAPIASLRDAIDAGADGEPLRDAFDTVAVELELHPDAATPSATFDAAATVARRVARHSLPLAIALVMHLYPYCALKCVPLPWWSPANLRRHRLLREIQDGGLILANAGGERVHGAPATVTATRIGDGILLDARFEYVSLAHVADRVLFSADCAGQAVFCVSDLVGSSVHIGPDRFTGSMRLSDTCPLELRAHLLPANRFVAIPTGSARHCMSRYQRSWFHLLLAEAHLARIDCLHRRWNLPRSPELLASLHELAFLRTYARCLLEEAARPGAVESLCRVSAAMKLRVSLISQATADSIRALDDTSARELGFIRRQPTCDDRILQSIGDGESAPLTRTG
jgi:alkylation response protein AidB-like acyl-CoA dehydrogenase